MKNLLFALVAMAALSSCSKDPNLETNEMLDGTWNVTELTADGESIYGPDGLVDDMVMVFKMSDDFTGVVETTATTFPGSEFEETETYTSSYEISNEGGTVTETDEDGDKTVYSISFDDDEATMEYTDNDVKYVQTAEKQ